jgi:hypothetical protein
MIKIACAVPVVYLTLVQLCSRKTRVSVRDTEADGTMDSPDGLT